METQQTCPNYLSFIEYLRAYEAMLMESRRSISLSSWGYFYYFVFRPLLALVFVLSTLAIVWWVAWKTVLVHVPLVQEVFGLRKKPPRPPRPQRRFTQYYNSLNAAGNPVPPQS